jgi:hypothetical protein
MRSVLAKEARHVRRLHLRRPPVDESARRGDGIGVIAAADQRTEMEQPSSLNNPMLR